MGLLTSAAALKYLFSGSGDSHETVVYRRMPTPEEIEENARKYEEFTAWWHSTNIYNIIDNITNTIVGFLFTNDSWITMLKFAGVLVVIALLILVIGSLFTFKTNKSDRDIPLFSLSLSFFVCAAILVALDILVIPCRFFYWLFSPVA